MQTVKVRLRKPHRVFTFLSRNVPLTRDAPCVVRSDRGLEYGVCVLSPEECPPESENRYKMTVVRAATGDWSMLSPTGSGRYARCRPEISCGAYVATV